MRNALNSALKGIRNHPLAIWEQVKLTKLKMVWIAEPRPRWRIYLRNGIAVETPGASPLVLCREGWSYKWLDSVTRCPQIETIAKNPLTLRSRISDYQFVFIGVRSWNWQQYSTETDCAKRVALQLNYKGFGRLQYVCCGVVQEMPVGGS